VGHPGKLPDVWYDVDIEYHPLKRMAGTKEEFVVKEIKEATPVLMNVGTARTVGVCTKRKGEIHSFKLKIPICAPPKSKVTISMQVGGRWRLVGYGIIK
jgi:translation initiation factor 2 subunit 3